MPRRAFSVPIAGTVEEVTEHFLKIVRGEIGIDHACRAAGAGTWNEDRRRASHDDAVRAGGAAGAPSRCRARHCRAGGARRPEAKSLGA